MTLTAGHTRGSCNGGLVKQDKVGIVRHEYIGCSELHAPAGVRGVF